MTLCSSEPHPRTTSGEIFIDWIETGAQAQAARNLVQDAGGIWAGVAVIVDQLPAARRRDLNVRALIRAAEL